MAQTIGKQDLVSRVAQTAGLPNRQAEKVVNAFIDAIGDALKKGEEVRLTGFGTFRIVERAPRKGRHPRTGEEMQIPGSWRPTFTPGSKLVESSRGMEGGYERGRKAA